MGWIEPPVAVGSSSDAGGGNRGGCDEFPVLSPTAHGDLWMGARIKHFKSVVADGSTDSRDGPNRVSRRIERLYRRVGSGHVGAQWEVTCSLVIEAEDNSKE